MSEIWKHVSHSVYVSNLGRVKSRKGFSGHTMPNGYVMANAIIDGKPGPKYVHRLVATAFIPNPEHKAYVNHKNGDRADNRVENLEWVTRVENERHAWKHLNRQSVKGEAHGKNKLTEAQVLEIRQNAQGLSQNALGAKYGVSRGAIQAILDRTSWRHI
jgi:hypothetical protein